MVRVHIGWVRLVFSKDPMWEAEKMIAERGLLLLLLLLFTVGSSVIVYLLINLATWPLLRIVRVADAIADGDFSQDLGEQRDDEFGTLSLNHGLSRHLHLRTDLHWTGPRPRAQGESRPEIPDYAIVDLAVTARDFYQTLEVQLAVHNLLDQGYQDPDTSGANNYLPGDLPREGVSVLVNILYAF